MTMRIPTAGIENGAVTLAKVANIASARLLGRATAGSGVVEELTASQVNTLLAGALTTAALAATAFDTDATLAANSATRIASQSAVKAYVDNLLAGLRWKASVRAASTAAVTLATGVENGDSLDGVTLATGDRILLKNQASGSENGIYVVAASGAPTRASDADTSAEMLQATVFVQEGTTNGDTQWTCTNNSITLGSTALTFAQVSGAGTYSAGSGLQLSGTQFSVPNAGITDAMLRNSAALSVLGRSANSIGAPADIAAGSDHQVLRRSGTAIAFGAINLAQAAAVTGALAIGNGGTGQATAAAGFDALAPTTTRGDIIRRGASGNERLALGASGKVLTSDGTDAVWGDVGTITAWVAYTPTFTGFGTVTGVSIWSRRVGDTLYIRGKFTCGTPTSVECRVTLGYAGTNSNVTSDATKVASIQVAGQVARSGSGASSAYTLIESSIGYITFSLQSSGRDSLTKVLGDTIATAGQTLSIQAEIPISGW